MASAAPLPAGGKGAVGMIVDVHTHPPTHRDHVPQQRTWAPTGRPDQAIRWTRTWAEYMQAMAPVHRAIVFGIAMLPGQREAIDPPTYGSGNLNDRVALLVREYPDKLIGFLSVHPDAPDALDELERATSDLGLRGLKLGPNYQQFDPLSDRALAVYAKAERMGLPILFHQGTSPLSDAPLRYAHPLVMDEIAARFPELRIVMAHMAHPWQSDCIAVIRKHPHVYADISAQFYRPWSLYNCLRLATEWSVLDKLLFGSDFPVATPQETIEGTRRVNTILEGTALPRVPEDELEAIFRRDALQLLGLSR